MESLPKARFNVDWVPPTSEALAPPNLRRLPAVADAAIVADVDATDLQVISIAAAMRWELPTPTASHCPAASEIQAP